MFSAFAMQGLEGKEKGKFTREELAPIAKDNIESLRDDNYFTYVTTDGNRASLADPCRIIGSTIGMTLSR